MNPMIDIKKVSDRRRGLMGDPVRARGRLSIKSGADDQSEDADDRCRITDHGAACGKYADEIRKIPIR